MAASAATARAAPVRSPSADALAVGSVGTGSESGRDPMRSSGTPVDSARTVATATATRDAGIAAESRGSTSMRAATTATVARGHTAVPGCEAASARACTAVTRVFSPTAPSTPTAAGTCCRKMIAAMPSVNPSTTGHGMKVTTRPSRSRPAARTITPPSTVTSATDASPCWATIGASTTAIAPVGPETWNREPPSTAATTPAITAVTSPAAGPTPELTPNASASGSATTPTVSPATRSAHTVRGRRS